MQALWQALYDNGVEFALGGHWHNYERTAPMNAAGTWISLFTPEATESGVIALLRDGDTLRIDLTEGRIRTGIGARELGTRSPGTFPDRAGTAYAARYASVALPALEGAGFG